MVRYETWLSCKQYHVDSCVRGGTCCSSSVRATGGGCGDASCAGRLCCHIKHTGLFCGDATGFGGGGVDTGRVSGRVCPLSEFFFIFLSKWCINSGEFCALFCRATHMQRTSYRHSAVYVQYCFLDLIYTKLTSLHKSLLDLRPNA